MTKVVELQSKRRKRNKRKWVKAYFSGGRMYYYFRRKGHVCNGMLLLGEFGSETFERYYASACKGIKLGVEDEGTFATTAPVVAGARTIADLVPDYLSSDDYKLIPSDATRDNQRQLLTRLAREHGEGQVQVLNRTRIVALLDTYKLSIRTTMRVAMNAMFAWAEKRGFVAENPVAAVKVGKYKPVNGFTQWPTEYAERFVAAYPFGTMEHVAGMLLSDVAPRRADVVKLGRQHLKGNVLSFKTQKSGTRFVTVTHECSPELLAALLSTPRDRLTFLVAPRGGAFSPDRFTEWFGEACEKIGLPAGYTPHGLRKTRGCELVANSCTEAEIMAALGQTSPEAAQIYIRNFNREQASLEASRKVAAGRRGRKAAAANDA